MTDLRPFHVQEWVDAHPHLSRSSRRNFIRSVKACVRWALHQGYIEKHLLWGLPIPANECREVTVPQADYRE